MDILIGIVVVCVIWAVVASLLIVRELQKRGVSVNFIWIRLLILKYLHQYCTLTKEESGHVGPLFYHYVVPLNVTLVIVALVAVISRC